MKLNANSASKIILSEPSPCRRRAARECGADIVMEPNTGNLASVVTRETCGGADVCIEAVGSLLPDAIGLVRAGGRVLQFGHDATVAPEIPVVDMLKKEVENTAPLSAS